MIQPQMVQPDLHSGSPARIGLCSLDRLGSEPLRETGRNAIEHPHQRVPVPSFQPCESPRTVLTSIVTSSRTSVQSPRVAATRI